MLTWALGVLSVATGITEPCASGTANEADLAVFISSGLPGHEKLSEAKPQSLGSLGPVVLPELEGAVNPSQCKTVATLMHVTGLCQPGS